MRQARPTRSFSVQQFWKTRSEPDKRTEQALDLLNESNSRLASANAETEKARSNLTSAIESIQEGFALFDPSGRLVMCNSRFGMHMPDNYEHLVQGLLFNDYVRMVSEAPF